MITRPLRGVDGTGKAQKSSSSLEFMAVTLLVRRASGL